ncbi:MAG: ferrochelatase [Mangrovibacterium sp.]
MKKGIVIINLGTIDSCNKRVLSNYLHQFLMDERVIDIPFGKRWLLVNLIIVPFRTPKVLKEYRKLFTNEGSPLLVHSQKLAQAIQAELGEDYAVELAMRYQKPSIESALHKLRAKQVDEIIVFPLFPQYASATVGSMHQEVMRIISGWHIIPQMHFVSSFYNNPLFTHCLAQHIQSTLNQQPQAHLVFSYHGIPQRHIAQSTRCGLGNESDNRINYNYQSACFHHSKLLGNQLQLSETQYTTCFQSRLGKDPWIEPYTSETLVQLAQSGKKNIVVCAPSFVTDCLETTIEIGEQYRQLFLAHGGESFTWVESLNSNAAWAKTLSEMIREVSPRVETSAE